MPKGRLRLGRRTGNDSDSDEEPHFKSGPLSHISERSEEYAGSAVGSVYHSVDGSAVGSEIRPDAKPPWLPDAEPPRDLKQVVREFVELGVPGRRVLVMQASGQLFPATFRLSRKIDTFDISSEGSDRDEQSKVVPMNSVS